MRRWLGLVVLFLAALPALAAAGAEPTIPDAAQKGITEALQTRLGDLAKEKNAEGYAFKRGVYSKTFKRVDDSTYTVGFHLSTAGEDQLKIERFTYTLAKGADGTWAITKEQLEDTYDQMWRSIVPDEELYTFNSLQFDREGMRISGGPGMLFRVFLAGKPHRYVIAADDLRFDYAPPPDVPNHTRALHGVIKKKFPEDFAFPIEEVEIFCTPARCEDMEKTFFTGLKPAGGGGAGAPGQAESGSFGTLRKSFDERKKETDKALKENYFAGFTRQFLPDRDGYTIVVRKRGGKDHTAWLSYDNYEPWEIKFGTSEQGTVFGYYAEETRKSGKTPYELEQREDADARYYETESLVGTVELSLQEAERLAADVTVELNVRREMREVPFLIVRNPRGGEEREAKDPKLFVNSVQDGEGRELTWVRTSPFSGFVVLPQPVPADTKVTLRMQFESQDSIYKLNNSYYWLSRIGWLPFVRFGDMIDRFELTAKVPSKFKTLGIGRKVSESTAGGVTTTKWVGESPVNFPTIIFGDYLEDKPSFPAKRLDGQPIEVTIHVDKDSTHALDSFEASASGARDIRAGQLRAKAEEAANALNFYSKVYGVDYPFHKLDLVNDPLGVLYGQAPSSIIYLGFGVFRGEGNWGHGGGTNISRFLKEVVPHEVGHQWWGGVITNANGRNYWFVESLAEYSSALFVEVINGGLGGDNPEKGRKAYLAKVADWRRNILESGMLGSVQNASELWSGNGFQSYQAAVYNQGPYAFHILRETFGDTKFFPFMKKLAQELKGKEIVTRDIQRISEESFGINMDWFWDQWIRGVGLPQFTFNYTSRKTEDGNYLIEGRIKQRVVAGPEKTVLPGVFYNAMAKVVAIGRKGEYPKVVPIQGEETTFRFKVAEEPLDVVFNKNGEILATDVFVNRGF